MPPSGRSVITIGSFDGVHLGHRALVEAARCLAVLHQDRTGQPTRVVALVFDPHPASVLRPGSEPARLTTYARRDALLSNVGAHEIVRLQPTPALLEMSPADFITSLVIRHNPVAFVEGADFRFGHKRAGDIALLRTRGRERPEAEQFAIHVVDAVEVALGDQSIVTASSTIARRLIEGGRVADAARVLGAPYAIQGVVVRGDRRGRTLGYPTANVAAESMLPADGVYAGCATAFDAAGRAIGPFIAAVSVGTKPQFTASGTPAARTLEAFLLDVPRTPGSPAIAGLPEYGWRISLDLIAYLRDQSRFDGVPALVDQIERDCARAREAVARFGTLPEPAIGAAGFAVVSTAPSAIAGEPTSSHACASQQARHPNERTNGKEAATCP